MVPLFTEEREVSRNGINSTEKNFIWSLDGWRAWGPHHSVQVKI